jgi:hypothetical protein
LHCCGGVLAMRCGVLVCRCASDALVMCQSHTPFESLTPFVRAWQQSTLERANRHTVWVVGMENSLDVLSGGVHCGMDNKTLQPNHKQCTRSTLKTVQISTIEQSLGSLRASAQTDTNARFVLRRLSTYFAHTATTPHLSLSSIHISPTHGNKDRTSGSS